MGVGWVFFPVRVAVLAVCAMALALAAVIFLARPDRPQNRRLATLLVLESALFGCGEGLMYLTDDPSSTYAYQAVSYACGAAVPFLFLRFYATLENPLSRILRWRPLDAALVAAAFLFPAHVVLATPRYVARVVPATDGAAVWDIVWGDLTFYVFFAYLVVVLLGFLVSAWTWREAKDGLARRQARLYFAAFGARDALLIFAIVSIVSGSTLPFPSAWVGVAGYLAFLPLLSYAMLKTQLFDIDLKIKWTIRRGTVAAAFVGVFFVVSELAQRLFEARFGTIFGLIAAGLLVFVLAPLQRAADRVADTAMPRVQGTPAYVAFRKMEVYKAALEGAVQDGEISPRERGMLQRLRVSLDIPEADALAMERDVVPQATPTVA